VNRVLPGQGDLNNPVGKEGPAPALFL